MLIRCDHWEDCSDSYCQWRYPSLNGDEIIHAQCSKIGKFVSVLKVNELSKEDPNYKFSVRKKRNGL